MICLELKTWLSCTIFLAWKFNNSFYGLMEREKEGEAKKELENENRVCLNPGKREASKFFTNNKKGSPLFCIVFLPTREKWEQALFRRQSQKKRCKFASTPSFSTQAHFRREMKMKRCTFASTPGKMVASQFE